jgi:hypothetical protein
MLEGKSERVQVGKGKTAANNGMKRIAALSGHSRLCRAFNDLIKRKTYEKEDGI